MKLEDFIASSTTAGCSQHNEHSSASETHVWISQDVSTLVNTGSILLRNTRWSRQLLRTWISMKNQDGVGNEQLGFEALYPTLSTSDRDKICILPSHVLNSISPPMKTLASSHQVMHLAAEDNVYRKAVLQEAAKALCESMQDMPVHSTSNSSSNHMEEVEGMQALLPLLPKQLGLTRNKLQLIAIDL